MANITKQQFIDMCIYFENLIKSNYALKDNESAYYYFSNIPEFYKYKNSINIIRSLRNVYQHNDTKINGQEAFEVSLAAYRTLKEIIDIVENPPLVKDCYIKDIVTATLNSKISDVINIMEQRNISHVPVLKDNKLIGVFSESTIFSKLANEEIVGIEENEAIKEYLDYINVNNHSSETFSFIALNEKLSIVKEMFKNDFIENKRLVMLFVTKNGKDNQDILGILTPWDVIE